MKKISKAFKQGFEDQLEKKALSSSAANRLINKIEDIAGENIPGAAQSVMNKYGPDAAMSATGNLSRRLLNRIEQPARQNADSSIPALVGAGGIGLGTTAGASHILQDS